MKTCLFSLIILFFGLLTLSTCKKKDKETPVQPATPSPLPVVSTSAVKDITDESALGGGNISSEGTSAITAVGICWDVNPSPTTLRSRTIVGAGTGTFASAMDSLKPNTTYFVRAYATNFSGTAYGNEITFKTKGQWETKTGSGVVGMCVKVIGKTVLFGHQIGVMKSSDNGETWVDASTGLSGKPVNCFLLNDNVLYAGTQGGGVFRSTNMGDTWVHSNTGISNSNINKIVAHGSFIFAATSGGVFVSTNGGANWKRSVVGPDTVIVFDLSVSGNTLYACRDSKIYTSSNDGATWSEYSNFFASGIINSMAALGPKLFVATYDGLYSATGPSNWVKVPTTKNITIVDVANNMVFSSGLDRDFYFSANNGETFAVMKNPIQSILLSSIDANDDYFFSVDGRLYRFPLK